MSSEDASPFFVDHGSSEKRGSSERRNELEEDVATMRRLGVVKWGEIVLGPAPIASPPQIEKMTEEDAIKERRRAYYRDQLGRTLSDEELKAYP